MRQYDQSRLQLFVKIGDTVSIYESIICGIPLGSTFGPLLFPALY